MILDVRARSANSPSSPGSFPASRMTSSEAMGSRIVLSRVDGILYAFRDACPACGSPMGGGDINENLLVCPSCNKNYDPRLAGRSTESRGLHLEPVPLLEDQDGVRVAIASPLMS